VDSDCARYLDVFHCGWRVSSAQSGDAGAWFGNLLGASAGQSACQWHLCDCIPEFLPALQRRPILTQSPAPRSARPSMAGNGRNVEESDVEPGGRTLHRMCPPYDQIDFLPV